MHASVHGRQRCFLIVYVDLGSSGLGRGDQEVERTLVLGGWGDSFCMYTHGFLLYLLIWLFVFGGLYASNTNACGEGWVLQF